MMTFDVNVMACKKPARNTSLKLWKLKKKKVTEAMQVVLDLRAGNWQLRPA